MHHTWIWLPKDIYPKDQTTRFDNLSESENNNYVVAEFKKEYCFEQKVSSVLIQFSADTEVQLFCNGRFIAMGPPTVGGDFLGNGKPREWFYGSETVFEADSEKLDFFARVKMCPTRICEFSKGHGGFMLSATVNFSTERRLRSQAIIAGWSEKTARISVPAPMMEELNRLLSLMRKLLRIYGVSK